MSNSNKWTFRYRLSAPTQDPYLLIDFNNESLALLFDCGVRVWGKVKTILKIKYLFITHAHIDHLIGFDHILRTLLGETKTFIIFGPKGIWDRLNSKLASYDWDRADDQGLILEIHELGGGQETVRTHECRRRFAVVNEQHYSNESNIAVDLPQFRVSALEVDHGGSPCLSYAFKEKDHYRIDKAKMASLGFVPGPWVGEMLRCIESNRLDGQLELRDTKMDLAWLNEQLVRTQPGRKITYITDTIVSDRTRPDLIRVCRSIRCSMLREYIS